MLIVALVSAHLLFTRADFVELTISGIRELVDAFLIPGITDHDNNRLMARPNVWTMRPGAPGGTRPIGAAVWRWWVASRVITEAIRVKPGSASTPAQNVARGASLGSRFKASGPSRRHRLTLRAVSASRSFSALSVGGMRQLAHPLGGRQVLFQRPRSARRTQPRRAACAPCVDVRH